MRAHREELQRVQIGLVGLAAILLIVTLANLVIRTARTDAAADQSAAMSQGLDGRIVANAAGVVAAGGNEPLADLGVTPMTESSIAPSVPDLRPDPRLKQRMDRDPDGAGRSAR